MIVTDNAPSLAIKFPDVLIMLNFNLFYNLFVG